MKKVIKQSDIAPILNTLKSDTSNEAKLNAIFTMVHELTKDIGHTDDIILNRLELASNLAHDRTFVESNLNSESEMFQDKRAEVLTYTEDIQDSFNHWYDHYETLILKSI